MSRPLIIGVTMMSFVPAGCVESSPAVGDFLNPDATVSARDAAASLDAGAFASDASPNSDAAVDRCNPVVQTGCLPPNTKCVVEGEGGAECVEPIDDERFVGETCLGRDCLPGLACARETDTATRSACVQVCDLATGRGCEALGLDYECRMRLEGTNWGACDELAPECEPLTQLPCTSTSACQPFLRRTGSWEFRCRAAGAGQEGVPCGPVPNVDCARQLACVATPNGEAFCRRICDPERGNEDCTDAQQCIQSVDEPPFMYCAE